MSASFSVQSSTGEYSVEVEAGGFARWASEFGGNAVIADEFFQYAWPPGAAPPVFVEAVETNKALEASPALIEQIRRGGANRSTELVAVGGGIIQDLSAFIASVYMRGLKWTYVPTTVLAMVDSCIGGKSSINVGPYKNLVGTFHPPQRVLADPEFVRTLPLDQRASGLIEAVKICFCKGAESFAKHMSFEPSVEMGSEALEGLILNSLESKRWFIEVDEFDKNERLLLNFGHTFGHAMEGASHFAIAHGIGVGLGIECAIAMQERAGVDYGGASQVGQLRQHLRTMVGSDPTVRSVLPTLDLDDVLDRIGSDKKHGTDFYTFILIAADGRVELTKLPRTQQTLAAAKAAVEQVIESYR
ncbi:3-dehydroquinate synthase [Terriglobus sp.]|uniref:3-dehydroquinate synthase n=1 Tax=Terriglobus sp. TaxID=1889013 RepID=UPI003B007DBA